VAKATAGASEPEDFLDLGGQLGMALDILLERRPLAFAVAVEELFGELQDEFRP